MLIKNKKTLKQQSPYNSFMLLQNTIMAAPFAEDAFNYTRLIYRFIKAVQITVAKQMPSLSIASRVNLIDFTHV